MLRQIQQDNSLSESALLSIEVSVKESLLNAVMYGGSGDAEDTIQVCLQKKKCHIMIRISDHGPGFNYRSLPNPLSERNVLEPGGRGIHLMKSLSDSLEFRDNGSTILLGFDLRCCK